MLIKICTFIIIKYGHARKIVVLMFHMRLLTLSVIVLNKFSLEPFGSFVCKCFSIVSWVRKLQNPNIELKPKISALCHVYMSRSIGGLVIKIVRMRVQTRLTAQDPLEWWFKRWFCSSSSPKPPSIQTLIFHPLFILISPPNTLLSFKPES